MAIKIAGKIDKTLKTSCNEAEQMVSGIGTAAKKAAKIAAAALAVLMAAAITLATTSAQRAMEFEDTMADVVKVVDGLREENGALTESYYEMADAIMDMSTKIPMTTSEIGAIMAAAGQAGIATEDLIAFTETAAKMGIAFDSTAEQAGEWMATWRTALNLTQEEVTVLGDQINYLGNTTSESALKLSEVVTRVGSLGDSAGLAAGEIAAIASSMTGVDSSISATAIKSMITSLTAGAAATTKQQNVLQQLGFTATEMAQRMQTDATGAITDLLGAINKLPEAERNAALTNYFGKGSVEAIAPLLNNLEYLQEQFEKVGDATQYAGSMEAEYAARADTTSNAIQLAQNQIEVLQIKLGNYLLPIIRKCAEAFGGFIDKLSELVDQYGPQVETFVKSAAETLDERVVPIIISIFEWLGKVGSFALKHKDTILALAAGFATFAGVLVTVVTIKKKWQAATEAAGTAMKLLKSPLGTAAIVIAALVTAGILLYQNWDTIKAKAQEIGVKISEVWGNIKSSVSETISGLVAAFQDNFPILSALISGWWENIQLAWENVKAIFSNIIDFVKNVFAGDWSAAWENIVAIFGNLLGMLVNLAKAPINGVISAINFVLGKINGISVTIPDWVPGVGGKTLGFNLPTIPALATGGIATSATLAMIGEGGEPEAVLPLSKLASLLESWGGKPKNSPQGGGDEQSFVFAPVQHFHGTVSKQDVESANQTSFAQFKAWYKQMKAEEQRRKFSPI